MLKYLISLVQKRNSNYTFNENIYGLKLCDNEKRLDYCKQTPLKRDNKTNHVGIERKRILELSYLSKRRFFVLKIHF